MLRLGPCVGARLRRGWASSVSSSWHLGRWGGARIPCQPVIVVMALIIFTGSIPSSTNHSLNWPSQYPGTERRLDRISLLCCAGKEAEAQRSLDTCPRSHSWKGRTRIFTLVSVFCSRAASTPHHGSSTCSVLPLHLEQASSLHLLGRELGNCPVHAFIYLFTE